MPTLKLSFGNSLLRELALGTEPITIGRAPESDLLIDNPAVSFHHAKVFDKAGVYYVQDLGSLNGTFLNGIRITEAPLSQGDVITIGKHMVRFSIEHPGERPQAPPAPRAAEHAAPKLQGTMILDTKMRREMEKKLQKGYGAAPGARAARMGKLIVLKGKTTDKEFFLTSQTSMVGKSQQCAIRLKGWFAPKIAAIINRHAETYILSPAGKKVSINGQPLTAKQELKEGDLLAVGKVQMKFSLVAW